jgi:hypothetical protein
MSEKYSRERNVKETHLHSDLPKTSVVHRGHQQPLRNLVHVAGIGRRTISVSSSNGFGDFFGASAIFLLKMSCTVKECMVSSREVVVHIISMGDESIWIAEMSMIL